MIEQTNSIDARIESIWHRMIEQKEAYGEKLTDAQKMVLWDMIAEDFYFWS